MKKIFQWKDLKWANMSDQEKLQFKRLLLMPLFVYGIYTFLNSYAINILIILGIYYSYKYIKKR